VTNLLGGKLLPLSVFPKWLNDIIEWTPFPYMVSFPTRLFLNELTAQQIYSGLFMTVFWCFIFTLLAKLLWKSGSYNYSGTGM
jgi:ABC-2 type transport system permease protein